MPAGTPYAAYNAVARVSSTVVLYHTGWRVRNAARMLETSHAEGSGFETYVRGLRGSNPSLEGWWDGGLNMHETTLAITDGATLTNVRLYTSGATSPYWSFPIALVESIECTGMVNDLLRYSLTLRASGSFVYPTGVIA